MAVDAHARQPWDNGPEIRCTQILRLVVPFRVHDWPTNAFPLMMKKLHGSFVGHSVCACVIFLNLESEFEMINVRAYVRFRHAQFESHNSENNPSQK